MARVQVTEYETVEKTEYKYECDECKKVVEDEDIIRVTYKENHNLDPAYTTFEPDETKYLCEDCVGLKRALKIRETEEYLKARWEGFRGTVDLSSAVLLFLMGAGLAGGTLTAAGLVGNFANVDAITFGAQIFWGVLITGVCGILGLLALFLLLPENGD